MLIVLRTHTLNFEKRPKVSSRAVLASTIALTALALILSSVYLLLTGSRLRDTALFLALGVLAGSFLLLLIDDSHDGTVNLPRLYIQLFFPPILLAAAGRLLRSGSIISLNLWMLPIFRGQGRLFRDALGNSVVYGEYGSGDSTLVAADSSVRVIYSVETSQVWADRINRRLSNPNHHVFHVDMGDTEGWGSPASYSEREKIAEYLDIMWQQEFSPDTVLIDGRFRVASFLTALKFANEGTLIIFDDYFDRRRYHVVEKFIQPFSRSGVQAAFIVPAQGTLVATELDREISNFYHVVE